MDKEERLAYCLKLSQYVKENSGEIALIKDKEIIVYYPYKEGKKYSKYIANNDFDKSLSNIVEYDSLAELSNSHLSF